MRPLPSMILSRRAKIALSVVAIVIVVLIVLVKLSGVYINYLWFGELHQRHVYSTVLWTKVSLFFIFGALIAAIIGGNLVIAYMLRPPFRPMSQEQQSLQNYVLMVEPRRKWILAGIVALTFLSAGASAQGDWAMWQLWLHGTSFGATDPQFHLDISFYAWDYPVYRSLLGFGFVAMIVSILLSIGVHYLTGAIRLQTPGPKVTLAARRHLTALVFVFMALKAVAYWLDRYGLVFSSRSKFTGASYTDVHSALPAKTILFWLAIVLALGVLASIWLRSVLLPGIGFAVLLVLSILISGIYPAAVQHFSVNPNASDKEAPFIRKNIQATRAAYDIRTSSGNNGGTVTYEPFAADAAPDAKANLTTSDATVSNIRILDPNVLSPTFTQQQAQQKNIYGFQTKLDVDRYDINGTSRDYIVGVRELASANLSGTQSNWINQHTNYTHGWGFVAAAADTDVTSNQQYADGNIPQQGTLNDAVPLTTPQAYYGELVSDYAIVGAKGEPREYDGDGAHKVTYHGKGGISLSSPLTKLAFAVHYKETNFLLNDAVSAAGARVMIVRDPRQRVEKVAPFLKVDGDPYPIVDKSTGHIVWMVDGYTTMDNYPYAERNSLSALTSSSLTEANRTNGQPNDEINYIRNSVKATVDAYDGTVTLYQWDTQDPVLKSWMRVFPGLVKPKSDLLDKPDILDHVRYPEDLFEVQRKMLEQYHVNNPVTFYNVGDKWTVPSDPAPGAVGDQPPYYVMADPLDGSSAKQEFQLTSPMKVNNKTNLAAYIAVDSDPANYGHMTVLRLGSGSVINGPEQVANTFYSTPVVSGNITLFDSHGSSVRYGNLLTLPVGNSFLYVEPLYVQASSNGYPILRRVLAQYGGSDNIGYGATLGDALDDLRLQRAAGATLGSNGVGNQNNPGGPPSSSSTTPPPSGSTSSSTTPPPSTPSTLNGIITQLDKVNSQLNAAESSSPPDLVKIAELEQQERRLVQRLLALNPPSTSTKPTATPTK